MSRQPAQRSLTLTEELEKLEQSITLTLQEIDSNFSKAHRIVTTSILPIVDDYAKHCNDVWEGSKFWKQFFEASANVSLSGYEEPVLDEDLSHTQDSSRPELRTPTEHEEEDDTITGVRYGQEQGDESFSTESPTQMTGVQSTPKPLPSTTKAANGSGRANMAAYASPTPRKYTGTNPLARSGAELSTPRAQAGASIASSPFEPESAYQASTTRQGDTRRTQHDPLLHRGVLDKNYRIQATPHTQRRARLAGSVRRGGAAVDVTPVTTTITATTRSRALLDDSPDSSPAVEAPQLRSDLFSPAPPPRGNNAVPSGGPRTPGVSVFTPGRKAAAALPTTSTGRRLFTTGGKAYTPGRPSMEGTMSHIATRTGDHDDDDDDDYDDFELEISPPKTMQFHVPQSRLLQTPAREASRRIVEDLLLTAGADVTDDIEGGGSGGSLVDDPDPSPSVVRKAWSVDDSTF